MLAGAAVPADLRNGSSGHQQARSVPRLHMQPRERVVCRARQVFVDGLSGELPHADTTIGPWHLKHKP